MTEKLETYKIKNNSLAADSDPLCGRARIYSINCGFMFIGPLAVMLKFQSRSKIAAHAQLDDNHLSSCK